MLQMVLNLLLDSYKTKLLLLVLVLVLLVLLNKKLVKKLKVQEIYHSKR